MNRLIIWLKALRASFFSASLIPVLAGTALASRLGAVKYLPMMFALFIVLCNHAGANLINDYYDAMGSDLINQKVTPFNAGSRVIQQGFLSRATVLSATIVAYCLGLGTALALSLVYHNAWIFLLALSGALLGVFYSHSAINGMGRGWGELALGMGFGPLAVMGSFILQTNYLNWESFWVGVPVAFLIIGVLILNEFPDIEADQSVGKRNLIVRAGSQKGVWIYLGVISLAYITIFAGVISGLFPVKILFSYTTLPLAVWVFLELRRYRDAVPELIPALVGNIGLQFLTGLLICLGLWWR